MLRENPHIWPEVVKTLNPATLLPTDSGLPEHNRLGVMDEVFLSQLDLTNQLNAGWAPKPLAVIHC
jgi:hypothetical protein